MRRKNIFAAAGCAVGGAFVGIFANQLNTIFGAMLFAVGIVLMCCCSYGLAKEGKDK